MKVTRFRFRLKRRKWNKLLLHFAPTAELNYGLLAGCGSGGGEKMGLLTVSGLIFSCQGSGAALPFDCFDCAPCGGNILQGDCATCSGADLLRLRSALALGH